MGRGYSLPSAQDLKPSVTHILKTCKHLEYLEFESSLAHLVSVMEGIEDGIFETAKWHRRLLKIRLTVLDIGDQTVDIKSIVKHVVDVIHRLERSHTADFLFTFDLTDI